ncbi:enoyl-CoA hydratase [Afipia sp. P52-10]|jgi:enoyl-CoA hydratase/carnithine racemase|uniref:enoyl-CoA hydratase-related protein n=1 Tax=Afipia sp. P52-10 TaxID=1429916 RepID=UPI0003DF0C8C|nr:enoyl-CoA hydratase-related protein [Afipia sp. P52-10]ETR75035.1 enoyl-CoA hydratase [Afipia sp. P52-10]
MSDENEVLYDVKDRIATITLNRPERMNSIDDSMPVNIAKAMAKAGSDPGVRVIILTGAGRAFCAGADIGRLQRRSGGERPPPPADDPTVIPAITLGHGPDLGKEFADVRRYSYFMRIGKPVIAALNGATAGLGMIMALCADMRFATDKMIFTTAFAQRGLIAEHGIAWLLPRLVGPSNAVDLLLSARRVTAQEALAMNLVNRVFPQETFMDDVRAYARTLADTVSPHSMAVIKAQIWKGMFETYAENLAEADRQIVLNYPYPDYKEGVSHFVEKRPANFPDLTRAS